MNFFDKFIAQKKSSRKAQLKNNLENLLNSTSHSFIFNWKRMGEGEVESATTSWQPSCRPSSARLSFRLGRVFSSMLGTVCMYRVLFLPSMLVVIPGP